jgi:hypothetical protein
MTLEKPSISVSTIFTIPLTIIVGLYRGTLGAGEAIVFALDSIATAYVTEAAIIFSFYTAGVLVFLFASYKWIDETTYFKEDEVVVPNHILIESGHEKEIKVGQAVDEETDNDSTPVEVTEKNK